MSKRIATDYPGVVYRVVQRIGRSGTERMYYARYKVDGKLVETKLGRQYADDLTPARAARIRSELIEGRRETRKERRVRVEREKAAAEGKWTLDHLAEAYFNQRSEGWSRHTDEGRYRNHLKPAFGSREPSEIIKLDVDRLRIQLSKKLKPQTVAHVLTLLNIIVNYGAANNFCKPLSFKIKRPTVNNEVTEYLNGDQLHRYLQELEKEPDDTTRNALKLVLNTGIRRGELFKLKWRDVDFDRGFLEIRDPKGGPSQKIPLNDAAREILAFHPRRDDTPYVFPGNKGRQRQRLKIANKIRDRAGLPKSFRPLHGLRHAYASMLASSGMVDMYSLQKLLTHKSPTMTQRYAHLHDEALKRAAGVADDILSHAMVEAEQKQEVK